MRCPNPVCRVVFEVKEEETATPLPAPTVKPRDVVKPVGSHVSGSVGEMVPILTGEAVEPSPPSDGKEVSQPETPGRASPPWDKMPPPVRGDQVAGEKPLPKPAPDRPAGAEVADEDDFLDKVPEELDGDQAVRELAAGTWEAPPVRNQGSGVSGQDSRVAGSQPLLTTPHSPLPTPHSTHRRVRWVILLLLVVLSGGVAWGFWYVRGSRTESEAVLFQKAETLYQEGKFPEAVILLQTLNRDFPDSKNRNLYRFLAELSDVRDPVYYPQGGNEEMVKTLDRILQFLKVYHEDPLLTPYEGDVWHTLFKLSKELTEQAAEKKDRLVLQRARQALDQGGALKPPPASNALEKTRLAREEIAKVEARIRDVERRQALIERVRSLKPTAQAVQQARNLVLKAGLKEDAELQKLLSKLGEDHVAAVTYSAVKASPTQPAKPDAEPSLLIAPRVDRAMERAQVEDQRPVFALVRGVLYALAPGTGEVLWARRIGVDTILLPLRQPATPIAPEIALVLSSDSKTVSALEAPTGRMIWEHQLEEACLGQSVLTGNRLLIPTYSGRVDEIDIRAGLLMGYYHLGQPLTVGGVLDERTGLAYFPADNFAVYVLDVNRRQCAGVLYSNHPSGSLRSAPVVLSDAAAGSKGLLLLPLAQGLDAMLLRAFELPIRHPDQQPLAPDRKIRGWTWFPPYHDGERLALATDAGIFALFGTRQKGNRDPLLFPMLKEDVVMSGSGFGRAQIVHADAENFWVLSRGRLQRLQWTFSPKTGPGILERWSEPPTLGSPLHAAQIRAGKAGDLLFLVTRIPGGQTCLASAVDDKSGTILWQRQLGLECRGQPLLVDNKVLVKDSAGVFLFDPAKANNLRWQQSSSMIMASGPQGRNILVTADKGAALVNLIGLKMQVAPYQDGQNQFLFKTHELPAPLAGTPALGQDCLVLPLANGILLRIPLKEGQVVPGPNWRAAGAEEDASSHVLALPGNDFLVTDGSRGLHLIRWAEPKVWDKKKSVELSRRIIAPPLVLLSGKEKNRIVVADAADTITLLDADTLAVVRTWTMPAPISGGPFVQGSGIGCVVGKNRLVWIDPDKEGTLWEYTFVAEIVGVPQIVDGVLLVANLAGQFLGLEPANGRPRGPGYTLKTNVAPTAAPVPFGPEHLFVPLTDGTVMLLDRKFFR
jgi:outer membrane protein assembly factor BamB